MSHVVGQTPDSVALTSMREARALIERHGHIKHTLRHPRTGALCLRGALISAAFGERMVERGTSGTPYYTATYNLLLTCELAMGFTQTDFLTNAALWNNHPETTMEDVLARLDQGIATLLSKDTHKTSTRDLVHHPTRIRLTPRRPSHRLCPTTCKPTSLPPARTDDELTPAA